VEPIYFHVILNEGKKFSCEAPDGHNSFIYLLKGQLKIGEKEHEKTSDSNLILLESGNKLIVNAAKKSEFLFIAGKPIGEPIARGGPFVMNTKAEILEAVQDYNNGTFAKY
jgi:redox-sensitive bicupin YhaK (pirin superfamily)